MTSYNVKNVLNNIELVLKTNDINKLNGTAYNFLYLMDGFIAHYDINGFKHYYNNVENLLNDIKNSYDLSEAERYINDGFFTSKDPEYYRSKYDILVGLRELTNKYSASVQSHANDQTDYKWQVLKASVDKAENDPDMQQQLIQAIFN